MITIFASSAGWSKTRPTSSQRAAPNRTCPITNITIRNPRITGPIPIPQASSGANPVPDGDNGDSDSKCLPQNQNNNYPDPNNLPPALERYLEYLDAFNSSRRITSRSA